MLFGIVVFGAVCAGLILVGLYGTSPKKRSQRNAKGPAAS